MHRERRRIAEQLQEVRRHLQKAETTAKQAAARDGAAGEREKAEALGQCRRVFGAQIGRPDLGLTPNLAALEALLRLKVQHMEEEIDASNRLGWLRGKESATAKREAYAFALALLEDLKPDPSTQGREDSTFAQASPTPGRERAARNFSRAAASSSVPGRESTVD